MACRLALLRCRRLRYLFHPRRRAGRRHAIGVAAIMDWSTHETSPLSERASNAKQSGRPPCLATFALLAPLDEIEEEALALLLTARHPYTATDQKLVELAARAQRLPVARQPILGRLEAAPARERCRKVRFAPFGMALRLRKRFELREETPDEILQTAIGLAALWPIVGNQHRRGRDRLDVLAWAHEPGIVLAGQNSWQVIVLQRLGERHRQEAQAPLRSELCHRRCRLAGDRD